MRAISVTVLVAALQIGLGCSEAVGLGRRCAQDESNCGLSNLSAADAASGELVHKTASAASPPSAGATDAAKHAVTATVESLSIEAGSREQFCRGRGPAVRVVPANETTAGFACSPSIVRRLFSYALCSCGDVKVLDFGYFTSDSFDSRMGAFSGGTGQSGAAVGMNGLFINRTTAATPLRGTVIIAGEGSLQLEGPIDIGGDLKTNATLELASSMFSIARDLWVNADIHGTSAVKVPGNVYQTPGRTGAHALSVGGSVQTRDFVVRPPCACGADAELDVAAMVAKARASNDNAELGMSASELSAMLGNGTVPASLTCGRFALDSVSIPGDTLAKLSGRTALFVDGDLTINGDFASKLEPNAELDVFVSGNLLVGGVAPDTNGNNLSGAANVGMPERPAAVRLYVAGTGPIYIHDSITYAAQLYAPRAALRASSVVTATTYGSMFVGSYEQHAFSLIHYDRAILDVGETCAGSPPPACVSSKQCPFGLACVAGVCAACSSDEECGDPMICVSGSCAPLPLSN